MSPVVQRLGMRFPNWDMSKLGNRRALLCLIVALGSWFAVGPIWVASMRPASDEIIDFYQDWGSARNFWGGLPVYTHHAISIPQHLGLLSYADTGIEYNAHPPTSVLLVLPLGLLEYRSAVLIWNILSLFAFAISLLIVAYALATPSTYLPPMLAVLPLCVPIFGNLQVGQLNLSLVLLVTAAWALDRAGWSDIAGILLGSAAAIKLFPLFLAIHYLALGRIRLLQSATLCFLALTFVTVLVLGVDTYRDYVSIVLPRQAKFEGAGDNLSIAGFWHKLLNPSDQAGADAPSWTLFPLTRWGIAATNLAITSIVATLSYRARTMAERDFAFALAVTAMLLVSPVTWQVTLVFLLVPIAILIRSGEESPWIAKILCLIMPIILLPQRFLAMLILGEREILRANEGSPVGTRSIKFYALLAMFATLCAAFHTGRMNAHPTKTDRP